MDLLCGYGSSDSESEMPVPELQPVKPKTEKPDETTAVVTPDRELLVKARPEEKGQEQDEMMSAATTKRGHEPGANDGDNKKETKRLRPAGDGFLCCGCNVSKDMSSFSSNQRKKRQDSRKCKECIKLAIRSASVAAPLPPPSFLTCAKCQKEQQKKAFSPNQWNKRNTDLAGQSICIKCNQAELICCVVCKISKTKTKANFSKVEQEKGPNGKCKMCKHQEYQLVSRERIAAAKAEKDRKLAEPRKCSECGEAKPKEEYSRYQWSTVHYDREQKCLACYPFRRELVDIDEEKEREEALQQQKKLEAQAEYWNECETEFTKLATKGVSFYDFDQNTVPRRAPELAELAELKGEYSIIFHHGYSLYMDHHVCTDPQEASRTARGTLTFGRDPKSEKLVGQIEFDKSFPAGNCESFNPTYKIVPCDDVEDDEEEEMDDEEEETKDLRFKVEDLVDPDGIVNPYSDEDQTALLAVVTERVGLPWKPTEELSGAKLDRYFQADKLVKFSSLEEAEALMKEHDKRTSDRIQNLLPDHLPAIGDDIAKKIHEYAPTVSPPVFFLESGDLCLYTEWDNESRDGGGDVASYIIARKKIAS